MKKKLTALFSCLILTLALLSTGTMAASVSAPPQTTVLSQVYSSIDAACHAPNHVIGKKSDAVNLLKANMIVFHANCKIEMMVAIAQRTPKDDVAKLLVQVERVVEQTRRQVNRLGYEVECTYTEYIIDGQTVLIDPLRVINPR